MGCFSKHNINTAIKLEDLTKNILRPGIKIVYYRHLREFFSRFSMKLPRHLTAILN